MSPNGNETLRIQRTVFDLASFSEVTLKKDVEAPKRPSTPSEALEMVGGSTEKLIDLIYKGLKEEVRNAEYEKIEGFRYVDDNGNLGEPYEGKFADESKQATINAVVLNIAKLQGYNKDMTAAQKEASKEKARSFIRDNPAMIASIQS